MRFNLFEEYFTYKEKYGDVEKLYLYTNQITAIPESWIFNGEILDLSNNQITDIPEK